MGTTNINMIYLNSISTKQHYLVIYPSAKSNNTIQSSIYEVCFIWVLQSEYQYK